MQTVNAQNVLINTFLLTEVATHCHVQMDNDGMERRALSHKDHFFVPTIRCAMHDAICSLYTTSTSGENDALIDEVECRHYANTKNLTFEHISNSTKAKGCFIDTTVFFNDVGMNCSSTYMCIQRLESSYNDSKTNTCMDIAKKPFVKIDMYFDKSTSQEIYQQFECQIIDNFRVECPKCVCFDDDRHGRWDSFACDRCQKGYGNSQCNQVCPGFDGVDEQSMCNYPHGMCQFGTIKQGNLLEHPPVQCMCGERGRVGSGIERVEVNNQYKYEMVVKNVSYSSFGTFSSQDSRVECDSTKKIDECFILILLIHVHGAKVVGRERIVDINTINVFIINAMKIHP